MKSIVLLLGLSIGGVLNLSAQNPAQELAEYQAKYKGQNEIVINVSSALDFVITDSGKLEVIDTRTEERIYTNQKLSNRAGTRIYYSGAFNEVYDIEAYTLVPEGSKYKKVKVTHFEHEEEISDDYFDDDVKYVSINFKDVKEGAKTFVSYKVKFKEPRLLYGFTFQRWAPVANATYSVKYDNRVELKIVEKNFSDIVEKTEGVAKNKKKIITWKVKNLEAFKEEEQAPNTRYFAAHVIPIVTWYLNKKDTVKVLGSVDNLHNWYASLLKSEKSNTSDELKKVVDTLMVGANSEAEKVKRIYYWVHKNIKYIAFEAGMEGFVPRLAKDVCLKRFGDCKDMSNLQYHMMKLAGIDKGHHVWVGTRAIPYKYAEVPSSACDNHMIAAYWTGDSIVFLDGTATYTPFGMPSSGVQGKQGLVHIDSNHYRVFDIPVMSEQASVSKDSVRIKLTGNRLTGNARWSGTGYFGYMYRNYLNNVPKASYDDWVKKFLSKGNNKFTLDTFLVGHSMEADYPLDFMYKFKLDNYVKSLDDELYLNLALDRPWQSFELKKDREYAYETDFKSTEIIITEFEIPEGYEVTYLPPETEVDKGFASIKFRYVQKGNLLVMEQTLKRKYLLLKKSDFPEFNKLMAQLTRQYNESVVLKKRK